MRKYFGTYNFVVVVNCSVQPRYYIDQFNCKKIKTRARPKLRGDGGDGIVNRIIFFFFFF